MALLRSTGLCQVPVLESLHVVCVIRFCVVINPLTLACQPSPVYLMFSRPLCCTLVAFTGSGESSARVKLSRPFCFSWINRKMSGVGLLLLGCCFLDGAVLTAGPRGCFVLDKGRRGSLVVVEGNLGLVILVPRLGGNPPRARNALF